LCLILFSACNQIKNAKNKSIDKTVEILKEPIIEDYSLFDKFSELKSDEFKIDSVKGIKCEYIPFFYKYYFRYSGDRKLIQQFISNIQCHYTEIIPDTTFIKSNFTCFEKEIQHGITKYEIEKAKFFFEYRETDSIELKFYTCVKTPEKHFIIFDLKNNLIYQMIENFRE
jgi:hypothetical protein